MRKSYPRRFGKYVLVAPLAKGGMGELHLAFSGRADLKKLCVIKTILSHLADDDFVARFLDEAKVVVKLSHGNLIPVFEAGKVDGQYFVAMEHIDGKDLRDVWQRLSRENKRFPLDVSLFIIKEVCRGLSYVHTYSDLHLVHRDVSPPNVMLSYTGDVRLTDFGVATSTIKLQKTAPGILLGKLSYMSPEQARNEPVDCRADLYSLGVILWELLTGRRLFPPEGEQLERYQRVVNPEIEPPSKLNPKVPPQLDLIVLRALAQNRKKRYSRAEQMHSELTRMLADLAPAIDGSSVQRLLVQLYGKEIDAEQKDRAQLVESMGDEVRQLASGVKVEAPSPKRTIELWGKQPVSTGYDATAQVGETDGSAPYLVEGTLIGGRYRIEELIGEGGMGRVYLSTHAEIGKKVAVKILHPSYGQMPDVVARFRREARSASQIGHPHIIEVFDSGTTEDGSVYFVMELLSGIDLADVLSSEGKLTIERTLRIAIQICEAVSAAHEAGIIHRDLKPENIYLTTGEGSPDFVKVLDFGLATTTRLEEPRRERLTNPGIAVGTPEYMAPEQAAGQPIDHRADIYTVGTLIYEMLLGDPPHIGENIMDVLNRKATEPILPPSEIRPEVPAELDRLVMWALEYNPDDRLQTMAQMTYELNKLARGRANAVASLLGIPASSRNTSGSILSMSAPPEEAKGYADDSMTAHLPPSSGRMTTIAWVSGGVGVLAAAIVAAVVLLKPVPNETPQIGAVARASRIAEAVRVIHDAAPSSMRADAAAQREREAIPDAGSTVEPGTAPAARRMPDAGGPANKRSGVTRPGRGVSPIGLGRSHLRAGRFEEARAAFVAGLRKPQLREQARVGLSEVEFQLGNYKEAERHALQAVSRGGAWRAKLVLGNVYYKLRQYRKAIKLYKAVLSQRRHQQEARRNLKAAQQRLNQ